MKFGFRRPSLRGRLAARTSWKRYVRHSLGVKAPRGWGWITDPKRAMYNRIYARTTIDPLKLLTARRRGRSGLGLFGLLIVLLLLSALFGGR